MEVLSEKELIQEALGHMSEALCFLYETKTKEGQCLAFMADSVVKMGTVIVNGDRILDASADYTAYEQMVYDRNQLKVVPINCT